VKQALLIGPIFESYHVGHVAGMIAQEGYVNVVAVDGGADLCALSGVIPGFYIGDGDSISPQGISFIEQSQAQRIELPTDKDFSDFSATLDWLKGQGVSSFDCIGMLGGRLDQQLGVFGDTAHHRMDGSFFGDDIDAWVLSKTGSFPKKHVLSKARYKSFSVFALSGEATVSIDGARWPLHKRALSPMVSVGLSNEFAPQAFDARVMLESGTICVVGNK